MKGPRFGVRALVDRITRAIVHVRGCDVLLATDLANIYGVPMAHMTGLVRKNAHLFPESPAADRHLLRISAEEYRRITNRAVGATSVGSSRRLRWAFTLYGSVMVATVLDASQANNTAHMISQAFVHLRRRAEAIKDIAERLPRLQATLNRNEVVLHKAQLDMDKILLELTSLVDVAQASGLGDSDSMFAPYEPFPPNR